MLVATRRSHHAGKRHGDMNFAKQNEQWSWSQPGRGGE